MINKILLVFVLLAIFSTAVLAHGEATFEEAEEIIMNKVPCDELTEEQLEAIGDYFMEQMHPGEAHEIMDEMMGGEGSEALHEAHVRMGRAFYCGESEAMSASMMDMMMGRSRGMMDSSDLPIRGGMMNMVNSFGMMGGFGTGLFGLVYFAIGAFIFSIIFWLTYNWLAKSKKR